MGHFGCSCRLWAVLDLAMGRFGHIENLCAVLIGAVLVHGTFWCRPCSITRLKPNDRNQLLQLSKHRYRIIRQNANIGPPLMPSWRDGAPNGGDQGAMVDIQQVRSPRPTQHAIASSGNLPYQRHRPTTRIESSSDSRKEQRRL